VHPLQEAQVVLHSPLHKIVYRHDLLDTRVLERIVEHL
jgi:hypothetical protein